MLENQWIDIRSEEDIEFLMDIYGAFHDGCIKELMYISGQYVKEDLSMNPINTLRNLRVIFQRQWKEPTVIEVEFSGLNRMNLAPADERFTGYIFSAYMSIHNGKIYWAEWDDFDIEKIDNDSEYTECTWICANGARWRKVEKYIGEESIFVER